MGRDGPVSGREEEEERAVEEPGVRGGLGSLGEERGRELRGVGYRSL